MTTQTLTLRTVLDAVPAKGATLNEIADALSTPADRVRDVLLALLVRGLVFMRWPFQQAHQWVPTAQAKRMADATDEQLRNHTPTPTAGGAR
jgi:hypothetical protein